MQVESWTPAQAERIPGPAPVPLSAGVGIWLTSPGMTDRVVAYQIGCDAARDRACSLELMLGSLPLVTLWKRSRLASVWTAARALRGSFSAMRAFGIVARVGLFGWTVDTLIQEYSLLTNISRFLQAAP